MMSEKSKAKLPQITVDFVTALPVEACRKRLEEEVSLPVRGVASWLAPWSQQVTVHRDLSFEVERVFPGAIRPIRLVGHLDTAEKERGTWVHGAVTHDTYNQVLIEGMIVFLAFFLVSAVFFLRLRTEGFCLSIPIFLLALGIFGLRWRALRQTTEDTARWVRRRLYVTQDQVK